MAVKKITKRWLFNNLGVILVILIALEIGFAFGIRAFYYNNVQAAIMTQANIVVSQLNAYAEDSSAVFSEQVRSLVENFQERNRMELMTVDIDKKVTFTSSGFEPGSNIQMPDFDDARRPPTASAVHRRDQRGKDHGDHARLPRRRPADRGGAVRPFRSTLWISKSSCLS